MKTIVAEINRGLRAQGAELTEADIGKGLGYFGRVLPIDVGKRVWLKESGLVMENNEQRDARKAKETT